MTARSRPRYRLNLDGPVYVWQQVADHIEQRICAAEFAIRLPNREVLAREYGVSVGSVRRAVKHLADRGSLRTTKGRGTYVVP
ncbi:GntR family transcriptional regulator [Prauserella sp. PE36]|nr:GntR family transcriptional regulator [Prauserella sp. PE36]